MACTPSLLLWSPRMPAVFFLLCWCVAFSERHQRNQGCNDLTWVALGDWGKPGPAQQQVVSQTALEAERTKARFALLVGDNFYPAGVSRWDDSQFNSTYEEVFTAPSLRIPHYVVLGNHDYMSRAPDAQVQRHYKVQSNWTLPHLWYSQEFVIECGRPQGPSNSTAKENTANESEQDSKNASHAEPVENMKVLFLFIDTMVLAHGFRGDGISQKMRDEHWSWLQAAFEKQRADWIIVVGHHPIYSAAQHGNSEMLGNSLALLLRHYGVDAYIAGHDHNQQLLLEDHSVGSDQGPTHIVTGSASKLRHWVDDAHPLLRFKDSASHGFASMRLNGSHLSSSWISESGEVLHVHVQQPREKPWKSSPSQRPTDDLVIVKPVLLDYSWTDHLNFKVAIIVAVCLILLVVGCILWRYLRRRRFSLVAATDKQSNAREVYHPDAESAALRIHRMDVDEADSTALGNAMAPCVLGTAK